MKAPADKKVIVGMSGGIDSTCCVALLKEQGYTVTGVTIINWSETEDLPEYAAEAKRVAEKMGIEHYIVDRRSTFDQKVIKPFVERYLNGSTPNPCIECNPEFKFRTLADFADRTGCYNIATGHYASIVSYRDNMAIAPAKDLTKDQSYFLWKLPQDILKRTLFPLAEYTKEEIRKYAVRKGFEEKNREKESMEICFIKDDYRSFLRRQIPDIDSKIGVGDYVDKEGHKIGHHKGFPFYTIGQRKGLEVAFGAPRYVIKLNPKANTVMLGLEDDLKTSFMQIEEPSFTAPFEYVKSQIEEGNIEIKIRYRSKAVKCKKMVAIAENLWLIWFEESVQAVTPGQYAVFYSKQEKNIIIGGAKIASQRGIAQYIEKFNKTL